MLSAARGRYMNAQELHPDFPIAEGRHSLDREWSLFLPAKFNRRTTDGNLVLWRPGITTWAAIWSNTRRQTRMQRLARIKNDKAAHAAFARESWRERLLFLTYRLPSATESEYGAALYCAVLADNSHVELAVHFDHETDMPIAESICSSVRNAHLQTLGLRR
jgi:hypothetical protein